MYNCIGDINVTVFVAIKCIMLVRYKAYTVYYF